MFVFFFFFGIFLGYAIGSKFSSSFLLKFFFFKYIKSYFIFFERKNNFIDSNLQYINKSKI